MADDSHGRVAHIVHLVRSVIPPIHRGGLPIVGAAAAGTVAGRTLLRAVRLPGPARWVTTVGFVATAATAAFFRAPHRVSPTGPGLVVAPADGVVALIENAPPPLELGLGVAPRLRVSIFLSVLDVHVQRIPMAGAVRQIAYHPGTFLSADLDKASEDNERNSVLIVDDVLGAEVVVTQIAGLLARRIICDATPGATVAIGDTYGLIRFGSRVDTYLPPGTPTTVLLGQRTVGGETVLATISRTAAGAG